MSAPFLLYSRYPNVMDCIERLSRSYRTLHTNNSHITIDFAVTRYGKVYHKCQASTDLPDLLHSLCHPSHLCSSCFAQRP